MSKKIDLSQFKNPVQTKMDVWTTSVNLEQRHKKFIERENINLSKLVRATLDEFMNALNRIKK